MLDIDAPFDGLDEVWIWPVVHPHDPEPGRPKHAATRIGTRDGASLRGRVELSCRRSKAIGGLVHELRGLGAWSARDLGRLHLPESDQSDPRDATLTVAGVQAEWTATGLFRVGDHAEVNEIATRGREPTAAAAPRALGRDLAGLGKGYARMLRDRLRREPAAEIGEPVGRDLVAGGGWLVATQHRTPVADGHTEAWQVRIDRELAVGSVGQGLVLSALGLVHVSVIAYRSRWYA